MLPEGNTDQQGMLLSKVSDYKFHFICNFSWEVEVPVLESK